MPSPTLPRSRRTTRDELLSWIERTKVRPGSQLPPEPQLAGELGVSRPTLREALRSLEDEGLVTRTRGTGTFLAHRPRARNNLDLNFGVTDAIRSAGMKPGIEQAVTTIESVSPAEAKRLALGQHEDVVVVERVRTADHRPVVFTRDVLPARLLEGHSEVIGRLARGSIYEALERDLGIVIRHGLADFTPVRASKQIASKLRISTTALLLYLRQVDYEGEGLPVLSSHEFHLADAFEFTVLRRGPGRRFG
jgi:DNA-binding GntR family transcriptional regulator